MQTPVITLFVKSPDGIRIAYDRCGAGPAVVLLHGGGSRRQAWHEAGYVKRLQENFTVITIDLRGHGESGLPTEPADYTMEKMMQDVIAVTEESNVNSFIIWGFSFGGRVARYLAAHSGKVAKVILMGTPLGSGISSEFRQYIEDFCTHWPPIIQAQREGFLDPASFSQDDQEILFRFNVPVMMAWGRAMLDWPAVEPADLLCPALWLVGSEDRGAMASVREYEHSLKDSKVQLHIVEGLHHGQVFDEIDRVFPALLAFTLS